MIGRGLLIGEDCGKDVLIYFRGQQLTTDAIAHEHHEEDALRVRVASVDLVQIVMDQVGIPLQLMHLQVASAEVHVHEFQLFTNRIKLNNTSNQ